MSPPFRYMEQLTLAAKLLINDKITALCQCKYASQASTSKVKDNKVELKKTVGLATFQKPQLQSVLIFYKFVHPCVLYFLFNVLFSPSLIFSALILYFTQFVGSSRCLNFDKSRDETPAFNKVWGQGSWICHYIRYCTYNLWTEVRLMKRAEFPTEPGGGKNRRLQTFAALNFKTN